MLLETMHLQSGPNKLIGAAWCKVAREAVGPEGHVVPQQWLVNTTSPGIARRPPAPRPRHLRVCCDSTLVSPLARDGEPYPGAAAQDGAVLRISYRRKQATYPELARKSFACSAAKWVGGGTRTQ